MGIDHNYGSFAKALGRAPEKLQNDVLRPLARETIPTHFARISTQEYMQSGPTTFEGSAPPRPPGLSGPLRKLSLRLSRAVAGEFYQGSRESVTEVSITPDGLQWTRKINVPYARIHEKGGSFSVPATTRVESAMWALYYETGQDRYKAFALATRTKDRFDIRIPERPYIKPALQDLIPILVPRGQDLLADFLENTLS